MGEALAATCCVGTAVVLTVPLVFVLWVRWLALALSRCEGDIR